MLNINASLFVDIRPKADHKFRVVSVVVFYSIQPPHTKSCVPSENQPQYQFLACVLVRSGSCSFVISSYGGDVGDRWGASQYHGIHKFNYGPCISARLISITNQHHHYNHHLQQYAHESPATLLTFLLTYLLTYLFTYLLTHSLHGAESFLRI